MPDDRDLLTRLVFGYLFDQPPPLDFLAHECQGLVEIVTGQDGHR